MAHDETPLQITEPQIEPVVHDIGLNPLTLGLSLLAGGGVTLMIVALAIGVDASAGTTNLLFIVGLLAFISGGGAWIGVVRPFENFDDINVPLDTGHGHAEHHEDEHALAVVEETHPTTHSSH